MAAMAGGALTPSRIAQGTNLFRLRVPAAAAEPMRQRLADEGIVLPRPATLPDGSAGFLLHVNESWNRLDGSTLATRFKHAAG